MAAVKGAGTARLIIAGLLVAVLFLTAWLFRDVIGARLGEFQDWVKDAGPVGFLAYILVYVIATVFLAPAWILTVGAGVIYPLPQAVALASAASTLAAACSFILARSFLRRTVEKKISANETFAAIDKAIAEQGWKIVLLIRLSPMFPYNLLNYALGLTRVRFIHYVLASWIGMFPGTFMYVYLGSLGNFFADDRDKSLVERIFFWAGLAATIAVSVWVARIARNALKTRIPAS